MTTDREINSEIDRTRVNALYRNGITGLVGVSIAAAFYVSFFWYDLDHRFLVAWSGIFAAMVLFRSALSLAYRRAADRGEMGRAALTRWMGWFYYTLLATSVIWVSAMFFPYGENSLLALVFLGLVVVALSASAIALYSHSFTVMTAYLSISILPLALRSFLLGERQAYILGFVSLLYYAIMIKIIREHHHALVENIRLSILNRNISLRDPLTGLANRRRLDIFVEKLIPMSARTHLPFCVIVIDIDNFRVFNNEHGSHAGDVLLAAIAEIIMDDISEADFAVRFGGEQFLIILTDTNIARTVLIADRLRVEIEASTDCTVSAGVAAHRGSENFDDTLRKVDAALANAKRKGRNRVEKYDDY